MNGSVRKAIGKAATRWVLLLSVLCPSAAHAASLPHGVMAFLAPWDPASIASLEAHDDAIGAVVPAWVSVTGADHLVTVNPDPAGHAALAALHKQPRLILMVQNALLGQWDGDGAAALLSDPASRETLIAAVAQDAANEHAAGVLFDFEALPPGAQPNLRVFLQEAATRLHARSLSVAVTAPVADPSWDLGALSAPVDQVVLMAYDQHYPGGEAGPIAANDWFSSVAAKALSQIPRGKAVVAIASYAYDWPQSGPARILSVDQAEAIAKGASLEIVHDAGSGHFTYTAADGTHQVWMQDAPAVADQVQIARKLGAAHIAVWRLGTEDPHIWG